MVLQHWAEAEELLVQAVRLRIAALGSEHSDSLDSKQDLALVSWGRGRYFEATKVMEIVVELGTKVVGGDRWDTQLAVFTLEKWLEGQQEGAVEEEQHEE